MALKVTITPEGRAALRNAQADGTKETHIVSVGVTATAFVPGKSVPAEIKRLSSIKGGPTAKDTMHVTVTDESTDVYSVRGFGYYLIDGTLFGSYGQTDVIVEKSAQALMALAVDVQFDDIDATTIIFGDTNFSNPAATTDRLGVVKLASDDDATTGTDAQRAITAKTLASVLNWRFGLGAPSDFVKTKMLGAANPIVFRSALALKSAALKDEGADNGLDADLLDGQHGAFFLDWNNFTNKPTSLPPSAHTHAWSDITSAPETATRWPGWTEVTGKPTTFAAAPHSHVWSDINNPPETAMRWPGWAEITGKPVLFAPDAHTHTISQVTGLSDALAAKPDKANPTFSGTATVMGAFRATGWNNVPTDGVYYFGSADSYIYKGGSYFDFKNQQGGFTATLNAGGFVWTTGNLTPIKNNAQNSTYGTIFSSGLPPDIANINASGNAGNTALTISNNANNSASAVMSFLRDAQYGVHFGLDVDNFLKVGGWSMGAVAHRIVHEGLSWINLPGTTNFGNALIGTSQIWHNGNCSLNGNGNGYIRFPNGYTLQWGTYQAGSPWAEGTGPAIAFPMAFPNVCVNVQLTDFNTNVGGAGYQWYDVFSQLTDWDRTAFRTFLQHPGGTNSNRWCGFSYFAAGY